MRRQPQIFRLLPGFTLIELMVTVGIIVILVAILVPVLAKARDSANTARCLSNQRQLMQAIFSYASDNDGYLAPPNWDGATGTVKGWLYDPTKLSAPSTFQQTDAQNGALYPYLNTLQVYRCNVDEGTYAPNTIQIVTSYMMNGAVCDFGNGGQPEKLRAFKSNAILLWEIPVNVPTDTGQVNDGADWPAEEITTRHQHGSTIGYADGHTEQMTWTAFTNEWFYNAPGMLWCAPKYPDGGKVTCPASLLPASPPPEPANGG